MAPKKKKKEKSTVKNKISNSLARELKQMKHYLFKIREKQNSIFSIIPSVRIFFAPFEHEFFFLSF